MCAFSLPPPDDDDDTTHRQNFKPMRRITTPYRRVTWSDYAFGFNGEKRDGDGRWTWYLRRASLSLSLSLSVFTDETVLITQIRRIEKRSDEKSIGCGFFNTIFPDWQLPGDVVNIQPYKCVTDVFSNLNAPAIENRKSFSIVASGFEKKNRFLENYIEV